MQQISQVEVQVCLTLSLFFLLSFFLHLFFLHYVLHSLLVGVRKLHLPLYFF